MYTLTLSNLRSSHYCSNYDAAIDVWEIETKRFFDSPTSMTLFLSSNGLNVRGLPYSDKIKIELHYGKDITKLPMLLTSIVPKGKRIYRPCVIHPDGTIQELPRFLNQWKRNCFKAFI